MKLSKILEALELTRKEFIVLCVLFSTLLIGAFAKYFLDYHIGAKDIEILYHNPEELKFQIDINHAEWYELTMLPQIGEKRARAIIEYRDKYGPFGSPEDLLKVKGINPKVLNEIEGYIKFED